MTRQIALAYAAQSIPMGPSGMVAEIAESIVSLASDRPILVIGGRENLGHRTGPAGRQLLRHAHRTTGSTRIGQHGRNPGLIRETQLHHCRRH